MAQTRAQARQSQIDALDSLGTSRDSFESGDIFTPAEVAVGAFIERVKANIDSSGMVVTGNISDLSVRVTDEGVQVIGNEYLKYQDLGVKGYVSTAKAPNSPYQYRDKMPPLDVFIEYVKRKNLNLRNSEELAGQLSPFEDTTQEEKIIQLAHALQVKVYKEGFKPRNIFSKEIPKLKEDLKAAIKSFAISAITDSFKQK